MKQTAETSEGAFPGRDWDQPLSIVIQAGLIISEAHFETGRVLEGIRATILRLESILKKTDHMYRFVLPFRPGPEHAVLETLLDDTIWDHISHRPQVLLIAEQGHEEPEFFPFEGEISFDIAPVAPEEAIFGYDPVDDAIIDLSNLVILVGEWEPGATTYRQGSMFELAQVHGTTVVAVDPGTGETYELSHDDRIFETYTQLDEYNRETIPSALYHDTYRRYRKMLRTEAEKAGLPEDLIEPASDTLLPYFTRTQLLARRYRRYYTMAGTCVSLLSALAVATITCQTLFFPDVIWLIWLEVVEILCIIILMAASRHGDFHRKWIDYNFLAERIRAAFFLCIVCIHCESSDTPPHMSLSNRPNDWMVIAFESIMETRPISYCRLDIPFAPMKKFFRSAWISNRLRFYEKASAHASRTYIIMLILGEVLFVGTLIFAVMHAVGLGHAPGMPGGLNASLALAYFTITLPAMGSAIAAIRLQREYLRNGERYAHVVRHLTAIRSNVRHAHSMEDLCSLLEEMNELTLREQQNWRIVFRFRRIEAM
ncbi:hypothetical protein [Methanovulcanius yangii]|uniref:hypothetical protein n=1 Tax=Methanovulcanius yangii TaxID=1789227 RepID=UPI0029C9DDE0|nr:hypothetical protein [Methanovulcanius yangii]